VKVQDIVDIKEYYVYCLRLLLIHVYTLF